MALFSSQKFDSQTLAARGELAARRHYESHGCRILARNLFNRFGKRIGEIDFIALGGQTLHFVEVKTRSRLIDRFGGAYQAMTLAKQRRLRKITHLFLREHPAARQLRPQVDLCLVQPSDLDKDKFSVTIIPNAVSDEF